MLHKILDKIKTLQSKSSLTIAETQQLEELQKKYDLLSKKYTIVPNIILLLNNSLKEAIDNLIKYSHILDIIEQIPNQAKLKKRKEKLEEIYKYFELKALYLSKEKNSLHILSSFSKLALKLGCYKIANLFLSFISPGEIKLSEEDLLNFIETIFANNNNLENNSKNLAIHNFLVSSNQNFLNLIYFDSNHSLDFIVVLLKMSLESGYLNFASLFLKYIEAIEPGDATEQFDKLNIRDIENLVSFRTSENNLKAEILFQIFMKSSRYFLRYFLEAAKFYIIKEIVKYLSPSQFESIMHRFITITLSSLQIGYFVNFLKSAFCCASYYENFKVMEIIYNYLLKPHGHAIEQCTNLYEAQYIESRFAFLLYLYWGGTVLAQYDSNPFKEELGNNIFDDDDSIDNNLTDSNYIESFLPIYEDYIDDFLCVTDLSHQDVYELAILRILMNQGFDLCTKDEKGDSYCHKIFITFKHYQEDNQQEYIQLLDEVFYRHPNIDLTNNDGKTLLDIAIMNDNFALIELLVKHGAQPNLGQIRILNSIQNSTLNITSNDDFIVEVSDVDLLFGWPSSLY